MCVCWGGGGRGRGRVGVGAWLRVRGGGRLGMLAAPLVLPSSLWLTCTRVPPPQTAAPPQPHPQRDGCPKIINLGQARTDNFYERKKYGFVQKH